MNGDILALGAVAAIAALGFVRNGSRVETEPCGDCYRWAAKFALALWEEGEEAALVHATVQPPFHPRRYGHAYVEWQGRIYDWLTTEHRMSKWGKTSERSWPDGEFREAFQPENEVRYTDAEDVLVRMVREGHWGPWENEAGSGSGNVVAPSGYHRTAVGSDAPSLPLRHLLSEHPEWVRGRVLDFGTGRGRDCTALRKRKGLSVACYDPNHPSPEVRKLPKGPFDLVVLHYVVNVLPPIERKRAVRQAASRVAKGGRIVVAARGTGDGGAERAARSWTPHEDGFARLSEASSSRFSGSTTVIRCNASSSRCSVLPTPSFPSSSPVRRRRSRPSRRGDLMYESALFLGLGIGAIGLAALGRLSGGRDTLWAYEGPSSGTDVDLGLFGLEPVRYGLYVKSPGIREIEIEVEKGQVRTMAVMKDLEFRLGPYDADEVNRISDVLAKTLWSPGRYLGVYEVLYHGFNKLEKRIESKRLPEKPEAGLLAKSLEQHPFFLQESYRSGPVSVPLGEPYLSIWPVPSKSLDRTKSRYEIRLELSPHPVLIRPIESVSEFDDLEGDLRVRMADLTEKYGVQGGVWIDKSLVFRTKRDRPGIAQRVVHVNTDPFRKKKRKKVPSPKGVAWPLHVIAAEIEADWKNVYFGAVPYLNAMKELDSIRDNYGADSGKDIVIYFLSNATSWRGETARRVKAELGKILSTKMRTALEISKMKATQQQRLKWS